MDNLPQPNPQDSTLSQLIALSEGQSVVTDGPLSQIYAKTLNAMYAKEVDPSTGVSLESQANDMTNAARLLLAQQNLNKKHTSQGAAVGLLYGVSKGQTEVIDVVQVSDALSGLSAAQKKISGVIVDAAIGLGPDGEYVELPLNGQDSLFDRSLASVAQYHGVAVFQSLEGFLNARKSGS